ncbi:MAG: UDP-N-acetylglucosamine--N-acetylmuramyl-(pentapeptide) pyrophosphoryl-undecaprenol N-acetylglucosamine transferase, partial [Chitinophagaceae bacterium]
FIHEANARPGRSNQLLAKRASKVFAGAAGLEKYFPADRTAFTGNPVRQSIVNSSATREEGLQFFGLNPGLKTVLVTGGSLGAKGINEAIAAQLSQLGENKVQLIWQTGKNFEATAKQYCAGKTGMWAGDFISRMELAYAAADVVVSRAGAMAIAELSVAGKPVIFVPYPYAAEDHQTLNAQYLVQQQAAQCIRDAEAKEKLVPALLALVHNEKACEQLGKQIRKLAITDADDRIAKKIYSTLGC